MTTRDYIMQPRATRRAVPKILNLSRSYGYQTLGYYCSLLAEARGHKVVPTVTTVLELTPPHLLRLCAGRARGHAQPHHPPPGRPAHRLVPAAGLPGPVPTIRASPASARQLFDWFRCPILEVFVKAGERWRVRKLAPLAITELGEAGKAQLATAIQAHVRQPWKSPRAKAPPRFTLGVLLDPKEELPPSDLAHHPPLRAHRRGHGPGRRGDRQEGLRPDRRVRRACGSARTPTSTTTPSASPSAPSRRACR